jgi:hypothetical protein
LAAGEYFEVELPAAFGDILVGGITCPASTNASAPTTETARCTATGAVGVGTQTITIASVTNPVLAGSQTIALGSYEAGGTVKEDASLVVAIIDNVDVSASVPSTLTFAIVPLASSTPVNGSDTTVAAATTSLNFGSLMVGASVIVGQELHVTTNANNGYTVTVEQDQNLESNSGAIIDSFDNGVVPANPTIWNVPAGTLDTIMTYGHMGFTTDDVSTNDEDFTAGKWFGFIGATPVPVMYHDGPADGSTQDKGMAKVAYRIQITALQEAGDYTNTLTYIATPTY